MSTSPVETREHTMTHDWFYMQAIPDVGAAASLDESEARHAMASRRFAAGDAITLFDGRGAVAEARISSATKRKAEVEITSRTQHERPAPSVTLASALPKGDRQSMMLNMAAQLGITRFIPLECERSVAQAGKGFASRTERICIEACKQSRQAWLPMIEAAQSPSDVARDANERSERVLIAHPSGSALREVDGAAGALVLMIGPEGGLTDAEVDAVVRFGALCVSLGENILRTETAAVALLAWARLGR